MKDFFLSVQYTGSLDFVQGANTLNERDDEMWKSPLKDCRFEGPAGALQHSGATGLRLASHAAPAASVPAPSGPPVTLERVSPVGPVRVRAPRQVPQGRDRECRGVLGTVEHQLALEHVEHVLAVAAELGDRGRGRRAPESRWLRESFAPWDRCRRRAQSRRRGPRRQRHTRLGEHRALHARGRTAL